MNSLMTTSAHPHVITAECPIPCLQGILPARTLNPLRYELRQGTVGDVARLYLEDQLPEVRGIGVSGIERIRDALTGAGLVTQEAFA